MADAFSVLAIVTVGYAFANALTFFLKRFSLPRLPLERGVPLAVFDHYLLLSLDFGCFAALANAAVELNKFTVLTGAKVLASASACKTSSTILCPD